MSAGKLTESKVIIESILYLDPLDSRALHAYGLISHAESDHHKAIELIRRSIQINPNYDVALVNYATLLTVSNQHKESIDCFKKALSISPGNEATWLKLASSARKDNQEDLAIDSYKQALNINPSNADTLNDLGVLYIQCGESKKAESCFERGIKLKPLDNNLLLNLGKTYCNNEKGQEAVLLLEKGIKAQPNFSELWKCLSDAYCLLDMHEKSLDSLSKFCSLTKECLHEIIDITVRGLMVNETKSKCLKILFQLKTESHSKFTDELLDASKNLLEGNFIEGIKALEVICKRDAHCIVNNEIKKLVYSILVDLKRSERYETVVDILNANWVDKKNAIYQQFEDMSAFILSMKAMRFKAGKSVIVGHEFINFNERLEGSLVSATQRSLLRNSPISKLGTCSQNLSLEYQSYENICPIETSISEKIIFIRSPQKRNISKLNSFIFQHIQKCGGNSFFHPLQQALGNTSYHSLCSIEPYLLLNYYAEFPLKIHALRDYLIHNFTEKFDAALLHLHDGGVVEIDSTQKLIRELSDNEIITFATWKDPLDRLRSLFNQYNREGYSLQQINNIINTRDDFMTNNNMAKCVLGRLNIDKNALKKENYKIDFLVNLSDETLLRGLQSIILGTYGLPNIICSKRINKTPSSFYLKNSEVEYLLEASKKRGLMDLDYQLDIGTLFTNAESYVETALQGFDFNNVHPYTAIILTGMNTHMLTKKILIVETQDLLKKSMLIRLKEIFEE
ncbi:tetratricopeptide repeat protein [Prochlorococcus marinus]|uniref:Uncharacterized protein n=1 Tax=Prochlorococcus marinus (strain MIT 9303) TaxID=59922 RepID=A2C988_PROM3|nr:tetratricopeptide repeat protein [Prochlorococcus marinus]ABM78048.1 Hypothetical protein P9303_13011 [Prochlorococcus marinus str. MIT 9303]